MRKTIKAHKGHYQIEAKGNEAVIRIDGDIGPSFWEDDESTSAKQVIEALDGINSEYITVRINSHGGSVSDGLAIHNALRRHPAAVTVEIDGVAMSIASLIAMAGDTVTMANNGLFMVHAPLTIGAGNAVELRKIADMLDKYAEAMANAYLRNGITTDKILPLLMDGEDHFYTSAEAMDFGFVDAETDSLPVAASFDLSRYRGVPAAAAAFTSKGSPNMDPTKTPAAPADPAAPNVSEIQAQAEKAAQARINERNKTITDRFGPYMAREGVAALLASCLADTGMTIEAAIGSLLDHVGKGIEPAGGLPGRVETGLDEREKFRAGASAAIQSRMKIAKDDRSNQFRGMALHQIAARALALSGVSTEGWTKTEIANRILAAGHTTSDFPLLLADAANKRLQAAYEAFPSTWSAWCGVGDVSDFKTVNLIRMGSFNSLDTIPEGEEYTQGTVGEEREQAAAATKGKFISLTRQMIINDDLSGFSRMAGLLGRAAARTVNSDVYGILNSNAAMSDGTALFHADHGNLAGSGAAISVATLGAGRSAMRKQTPPGTNAATEYLNIMPRYLLTPVVLEDHARTVVASPNDTDTAGSRKINPISGWSPLEVISDPVLDGGSTTAWYLASDPMDAPLVEVLFLDGNQTPFVDTNEEFLKDSIQWKVRMDYATKSNDYRGGYKNAGA